MGEKKVVSRKVALGIAVLSIVLLVVLCGILEYQIVNLQSQLSSDKSTINSLNTTISNLERAGFSVIQISDTQYLSDSQPDLYDGLTSWIADKANALNLTMVVHTGDIVQVANSVSDWKNASNAMMTLYNNEIPYCWDAGNHDQINKTKEAGGGNPNGSWLGGNYPAFNVTIMRQKPYWAGDISDGKDTAVQFTYGSYRFMVINIEYDANQTVLDWMQTLIKCNPNVNVIVATHNFLNGVGGYGVPLSPPEVTWATNFESLLSNYHNVFMTLSGHCISTGTAYHKRVGNREEIFFNRQEVDNQTGAATARIYVFKMSSPFTLVVDAYTYQTFGTPHYLTDPQDQFSFSTNLEAYSPSTVRVASGTNFLGASGCSVGFATSATLKGFSQYGNTLGFNSLTLNSVTSNFTVTAVGANIVISKYDPDSGITYKVSGRGSQTFSVVTKPVSVDINGAPARNGWSYSNGEVTITGATSSVTINLH